MAQKSQDPPTLAQVRSISDYIEANKPRCHRCGRGQLKGELGWNYIIYPATRDGWWLCQECTESNCL